MALEPRQITSQIYQGGWLWPQYIPELIELGITHVLNLDVPYSDPRPFIEANITLHTISIRDYCLMTPQLVREVLGVINECLSSPGHKIYIHCVAGVSRSPTIAWLYLIRSGLSPEEATEKIRPNPVLYDNGLVQQLMAGHSSAKRCPNETRKGKNERKD